MEPKPALVGMAKEKARIDAALAKPESVLLLGPAGAGKTRLLREAMTAHPDVLYVSWEPTLHALLVEIARVLIRAGHPEFLGRAKPGRDVETWLGRQTSVHLKGLFWSALETAPVPLVLDGIAGAGFPTYRFLQRIYHTDGMALVAASRDAVRLGALGRLFWNPAKTVSIPPLNDRDAGRLFEAATDCFALWDLDLLEFRDKVLENAHGNPGQIVEMCRLATQPKYISGRYIKFAPLRIDAMIHFAG